MDLTYLVNKLQAAQSPVFDNLSIGKVTVKMIGVVQVREWSGGDLVINGQAEVGDAVSFANGKIIDNFGQVEIEQIEVD